MLRNKIIEIARSFEGLTYDQNNDIIFITDYYGKPKHKKMAYCCMYAWDIFRMAGCSKAFYNGKKIAKCTTLMNWYKRHYPAQVHKDVNRCKTGDLIMFQFDSDPNADHIGIFDSNVMIDDQISIYQYYTMEGNTSIKNGSQSNGGYVARKRRRLSQTMCFIEVKTEEDNPYPFPDRTISKGCKKGEDVKWVQWALNRFGYDLVIDGSFGAKSDLALRDWQEKDPDLVADGRCGYASRIKLNKWDNL